MALIVELIHKYGDLDSITVDNFFGVSKKPKRLLVSSAKEIEETAKWLQEMGLTKKTLTEEARQMRLVVDQISQLLLTTDLSFAKLALHMTWSSMIAYRHLRSTSPIIADADQPNL